MDGRPGPDLDSHLAVHSRRASIPCDGRGKAVNDYREILQHVFDVPVGVYRFPSSDCRICLECVLVFIGLVCLVLL